MANQQLLHNGPEATQFGEITQNKDQGNSRSLILVPVKSPFTTSC